ncbi:hypothetical protein V5E97_35430 [Singulisphaera sp. Ch08]|uniref:Transposase n=1 Tax=Singulisphaera sp. Ch08 TaxID=3120278 RepID=A0AAU7CEQ6_9BACT
MYSTARYLEVQAGWAEENSPALADGVLLTHSRVKKTTRYARPGTPADP